MYRPYLAIQLLVQTALQDIFSSSAEGSTKSVFRPQQRRAGRAAGFPFLFLSEVAVFRAGSLEHGTVNKLCALFD